MPKLPILTGREIIKVLQKRGFQARNQTGSHVQLIGIDKEGNKCLVTVPDHGSKEIPPGTLLSILRQANITREDFVSFL